MYESHATGTAAKKPNNLLAFFRKGNLVETVKSLCEAIFKVSEHSGLVATSYKHFILSLTIYGQTQSRGMRIILCFDHWFTEAALRKSLNRG